MIGCSAGGAAPQRGKRALAAGSRLGAGVGAAAGGAAAGGWAAATLAEVAAGAGGAWLAPHCVTAPEPQAAPPATATAASEAPAVRRDTRDLTAAQGSSTYDAGVSPRPRDGAPAPRSIGGAAGPPGSRSGHDRGRDQDRDQAEDHDHDRGHGHTHGLVDPSIIRSRAGVRAVAASLAILGLTAGAQVVVFATTHSVALLADLIHNFGDALTAVPLGAAFLLRSARAERGAGFFVVAAIFVSAAVAFGESIDRLVHPRAIHHLGALAAAGAIGFAGNELAAVVRLRAGRALRSAALVADGEHARIDGLVSLGVVASAIVVALGARVADPLIGLAITAVILRITWQALRTVRESPSR